MKIFITGATGFIGSHLADLLKKDGHDIYCMIRPSSSLKWVENKGFHLINLDFKNKEQLKEIFEDMDYVYHIGGLTAAKTYEEFLRGNRDFTKDLISTVYTYSKNLKKFIYVSSQTVAGPSKSLENPKTEEDECQPITSYGKSKRAGELEVINYFDKMPVTIVRPPAVYGPRDTAILSIFQTVNKGIGTLIGFNKKYVSLIHSDDLVRGIKLAGESSKSNSQIYFISSNEFYNWDQLMEIIKDKMGKKHIIKLKLPHSLVLIIAGISGFFGKFSSKPPVLNYEKGIDFIQDYWICSAEKAKNEIGFVQEMTIEAGMENSIKWYKENNWL
jgi:dihydroflavonol-4-reductase